MELSKEKLADIRTFSLNLRKNILEMSLAAGASSSHLGGALSIVEIVSVLFAHEMQIKNGDPNWEKRDRFILSKGHACLAYYAALCEKGFIKKEELKTFEKDNSNLLGHPVLNQKIGIDFSNGSLGMGLSLGIGLSIASKKRGLNIKIYVIVGDGECNEGSVWEAAMAAPNLNLDNLYVIVDKNNFQQTGSNKEIMNTENLREKWNSFGWYTSEIDGHNIEEIIENFKKISNKKKPKAIIANTIKGKGFSFSENNNDWHHSVLTKKLYDQAIQELKKYDNN
jgi:transketolase